MQKKTEYLQDDSAIMNASTSRKEFLLNRRKNPKNKDQTYLKRTEDLTLSL